MFAAFSAAMASMEMNRASSSKQTTHGALVDAGLWAQHVPADYDVRQQELQLSWDDDVLEAALSHDKHKPWAAKKRLSISTVRAKRKVQDLKSLLRRGIPASLRASKWQVLLQTDKLADVDRSFPAGLERAFGKDALEAPVHVPLLGGNDAVFAALALSSSGVTVARQIMCIVAHDYPQLAYCPFVAPTVALLLHQTTADDALACTIAILNESVSAHQWRYFPCSHRETTLFTLVFLDVVKRVLPGLWAHTRKIGSDKLAWQPFWTGIFTSFFVGYLPLPALLHVMDSFCLEGCKIVFRLGLGVLGVLEHHLHRATSMQAINDAIVDRLALKDPSDFAEIFDKALSYSVQRSDWNSFRAKNQEQLQAAKSDAKAVAAAAAAVQSDRVHVPELSTPSAILSAKTLHELWKWVPARYRHRDLDLVFSTTADGYSVPNMFHCCGSHEPLLLLIRTNKNHLMGAFLSTSFSSKPAGKSYFGSGECFVFRLTTDEMTVYPWAKLDRQAMAADRVVAAESYSNKYRPEAQTTQVNSYFLLVEGNAFAIGGGPSGPALQIGDEFATGRSCASETFANDPLAGEDSDAFSCTHVEVYAFQ